MVHEVMIYGVLIHDVLIYDVLIYYVLTYDVFIVFVVRNCIPCITERILHQMHENTSQLRPPYDYIYILHHIYMCSLIIINIRDSTINYWNHSIC